MTRAAQLPEERSRLLLDLTHDAVFVRDLDGRITYWNRGAEDLFGWTVDEALGRVAHELLQTIWPEPFADIAAGLLRTGRWQGELVHTGRDGTRIVVATRWALQRDASGNPVAHLVTANDVTERKQASEALRRNEEWWRPVFEHNCTMYFMIDPAATVLSVNRFGAEQLGYGVEELVGHPLLDTFHEADREAARRHLAACVDQFDRPISWELRKVHKDGTVLWVHETARAMRRANGDSVVLIACKDITEAKRARANLEFFKHVTDQTHDPIFWNSPADGFRFAYVNEAACRHFGRPAEELLRMSVPDVDPNYPLAEMQKHWEELKRRKAITIETVNRCASGEIVPVEVTTNYVVFEGEEYVAGTIRDISERKRAEDALRASEERFRTLVDHATDAFGLVDDRGIIIDVNREACESRGYRREEMIGMSVSEIDPDVDLDAIQKRFEAGEDVLTFESRNRRKDGTLFPVEVRTRRFVSPEGRLFSLTLGRDITERKRAEEALRKSEELYRALIEVSPQMVWMTRADGANIYMNQWAYDYMGLTQAESEGLGWAQVVHPEHQDRVVALWLQAAAAGGEWIVETPVRRAADGQYRWHFCRGLPVRDADGRIVRWVGIAIDIHDRREAEEALRRSEAWLSEAQRLSHTGSWVLDLETSELKHWSPELLRICGFDPDAGIPSTEAVRERTHPEDRAKNVEEVETAIRERTGVAGERRLVLPDGTIRHLQTVVSPVFDAAGRPIEVIGTAMDVTERKCAEEALRESEQRYRRSEAYLAEAQRLSHTGNWAMNLETRQVVYCSQELFRLFGFDPEEGIPSTEGMLRRIHPDDRARVLAALRRAVREKTDYDFDCRVVRPDGTTRHLHTAFWPTVNAAGDPEDMIGTVMDTTAGKQAEEALRESEERYRNIFEKVGVAIVEEDFSKVMARLVELKACGVRDFRRYLAEHPELARETFALVGVRDLNEAAVALFGAASKQEFLDAVPRLATREVRAAWVAQLPAVAEGRRSVEEVVLTTLGGERVHTLVTIVLPPESSGFESVLVTVVDLSERKRAEEGLHQAQAALAHMTRVTTLGELTASIAHEVNQPLAAIVNNAGACLALLSRKRADVEELRAALADITGDAERASAVIERVRGLAKRSAPERTPVRLTDLVHEVVALMRAESATRRIAIRTDVPADLPLVLGDRVQLQQVLLNLVVNAMDAMSSADERERSVDIRGRVDMDDGCPAVTISVEDRGIGVQPEELDRLFEAFYTTKPHGMGLGLAISRSIIEAHGGRLRGESNRGRGAVFSFRLPAAQTSRAA
jgi:PAS domain S-box-containing protein